MRMTTGLNGFREALQKFPEAVLYQWLVVRTADQNPACSLRARYQRNKEGKVISSCPASGFPPKHLESNMLGKSHFWSKRAEFS